MTTVFNKPGDALDHLAAADISVNDVVVVGSLIGVAATNIANGKTGTILVEGVFTLPKVTGTAMPEGTKVTWDHANKHFIVGAGSTGDVANCAIVVEQAALSADTSVRVLLEPGMGAAVA